MATGPRAILADIGNRRIADMLFNIATLLELAEDSPYRVRAYRHAARCILALPDEAVAMLARGESVPLPGVGKRIGTKLAELVATGRMTFYDDLLEDQPEHIRALMAVDGIGPKTAQRLHAGLGVRTVDDLVAATEHKQVQLLFGFGKSREATLGQAARALARTLHDVA